MDVGEKNKHGFNETIVSWERVTQLGTATDLYCYDLMAFCGVQ